MATYAMILTVTVGVLAAITLSVYFDLRGERKLTGPALKVLQRQVAAQAAQIAELFGTIDTLRADLAAANTLQRSAQPPTPDLDWEEDRETPTSLGSPPAANDTTTPLDRSAPVEEPPSSEPRLMRLEDAARLTPEERARVDAMAAILGVTREEALLKMVESGLDSEMAKALARRKSMQRRGPDRPSPRPPAPSLAAADHCHGPACGSGDAGCLCICPRCRTRGAS